MKKQVQLMPLEVQQVLSPADCKLIIQAFEAGRAPQVNDPERIIGIYIVLLTGEAVLYDFDVLQIFIKTTEKTATSLVSPMNQSKK